MYCTTLPNLFAESVRELVRQRYGVEIDLGLAAEIVQRADFRNRRADSRWGWEWDTWLAWIKNRVADTLLSCGITLIPSDHLLDHQFVVSRGVYEAAKKLS